MERAGDAGNSFPANERPLIKLLSLAILLAAAIAGFAYQNSSAQSTLQPHDSDSPPLSASLHIKGQEYCSNEDWDVYTELLNFTVRYTNISERTLTIDTGLASGATTRVALSLEDLRSKDDVYDGNPDIFLPDGESEMTGQELAKQRLVSLKPGEVTEGEAGTYLFVRPPGSPREPATIAPGIYFLQLAIFIKTSGPGVGQSRHVADNRAKPIHWISVQAEPIQFDAPSRPPLQDCNKGND